MRTIKKKTTFKIIFTVVLIAAIVLFFGSYIGRNISNINSQNANYIKNVTKRSAEWIDDILKNAQSSINNMARLYGKTLKSPEVTADDLALMTDRSLFDYVDFVNADGIDMNAAGVFTDVSDRAYYIKGMQGEVGLDGTYLSKITNERMVIFYAPVKYDGEIIGMLTGHYLEQRMKDILSKHLFGETSPSFLCLEDGTIVTSVGMEVEVDNILDYMDGKVSHKDIKEINEALAEEKECAFTYKTDNGNTVAYMASIPGNKWTIIQYFPVNALRQIQKKSNSTGLILVGELVLILVGYMMFLLAQEWYEKKKLSRGKAEAEGIINGINGLFKTFIKVNVEEDTYHYMNGRKPGYKELPANGRYTDFVDFLKDKIDFGFDQIPTQCGILSREYIAEHFTRKNPIERYEYKAQRGGDEIWESMAVIVLEHNNGAPVSVLLAIQEITDLKKKELRTQEALKEAYNSAEAANHAKSDFLSRMSHDIRTPMNAIMGMTAIAQMHMEDKAKLSDCLDKISISSRHLLGLINEVLDMSKIESGKLELMSEEFDLAETVNGLIGIFHPQIEGKKQTLSVTLGDINHEKIIGDAQRLSQVLVNIMGNAVKFTPEGGRVSLHIEEIPSHISGNGHYEFTVTDTGIGMDEEFIDKMFEPFSRAGNSGKIEGTGLGMSIVKSIVNMMNGDIKVKSKKGEGTQITVTVYLQYVPDEEDEISRLAGQRVMIVDSEPVDSYNTKNILESLGMPAVCFTDWEAAVSELIGADKTDKAFSVIMLDWLLPQKESSRIVQQIRENVGSDIAVIIAMPYYALENGQEAIDAGADDFIAKPLFKSKLLVVLKKVLLGRTNTAKNQSTQLEFEERLAGKNILLVEDNEMNMEIAYEILTMAGLKVDTACNGKEAVERLTETEPGTYQVVLMDVQMPVMNGYEATKVVRASAREDLKTIPILAMTADAFSDDIRRAKESGMNGHISKPIDINKLMNTIKDWV